jgi:hypothetical protein
MPQNNNPTRSGIRASKNFANRSSREPDTVHSVYLMPRSPVILQQ